MLMIHESVVFNCTNWLYKKRRVLIRRFFFQEESTYRHALQCALNTSLICVAKAPSPTPLPRDEINPVRLQQQQSGLGDDVDNFVVGDIGSITNNTHMLVAKLKRSFGINSYLHGNLMSSIRSIRKPENFDDKEVWQFNFWPQKRLLVRMFLSIFVPWTEKVLFTTRWSYNRRSWFRRGESEQQRRSAIDQQLVTVFLLLLTFNLIRPSWSCRQIMIVVFRGGSFLRTGSHIEQVWKMFFFLDARSRSYNPSNPHCKQPVNNTSATRRSSPGIQR